MKFTAATILAIAAGASAQISLPLPEDLQAYTSSLAAAGNTDALAAVSGLFAFSDVQSVVAGALAHSITGFDVALQFGSAAQAWVAAQPASAQAVATSVLGDISGRAMTDGLLDELQTLTLQPGAVPTGGAGNATVTAVGPLPTGNSTAATGNSTTAAGNVSVGVEPTVITSGTVVISTSVTRTSGPSAVATTSSPGAAAALTGATGLGAGLIAALFAAVAAL